MAKGDVKVLSTISSRRIAYDFGIDELRLRSYGDFYSVHVEVIHEVRLYPHLAEDVAQRREGLAVNVGIAQHPVAWLQQRDEGHGDGTHAGGKDEARLSPFQIADGLRQRRPVRIAGAGIGPALVCGHLRQFRQAVHRERRRLEDGKGLRFLQVHASYGFSRVKDLACSLEFAHNASSSNGQFFVFLLLLYHHFLLKMTAGMLK